MRKTLLKLMCLCAMLILGTGLRAQDLTITLNPGWNWISYPWLDTVTLSEAIGSFIPEVGEVIEAEYGYSEYEGDEWFGDFELFYPGRGYAYYSVRLTPVTLTFVSPASSQVTVTTMEPTEITATSALVGGTVAIPGGCHVFLRGICWGTEPKPTIDGDHIVSETVAGEQSVVLDGLIPNTTYYVRAYVVTDYGLAYGDEQSFTAGNANVVGEHEYVDLGLPSGLLWATCNVGADTPEEYGDYFAWGETQFKETYNWDTYQYCNGNANALTKYCNKSEYGYNGYTDNLNTLLPEDDAAAVNWGDDWRMPTKSEWQELYDNTTVSWTTQNGINGAVFTASNGNSLFLPASGYRNINNLNEVDFCCHYWSNTLYGIEPCNGREFFAWWASYSNSVTYDTDYNYRNYGLSVRPVRSAPQNNVPTGAVNGKFSVSATKQVYFSQGNLQYQASTDTWRFAENQYDIIGSDNANISEVYSGWIDLFGWGTSGWDCGNTYYHPWDWDNSNSTFFGPPGEYNLTGEYANSDWGVYNPILNGGNTAGQWRTLTYTEWYYLLNTRNTISGIRYVKAQVNNVNGVILPPDDWDTDTYPLSTTNGYSSNILSDSQWSILEQAGCVFLPETSIRMATTMGDPHTGRYWTASYYDDGVADYLGFFDTGLKVYTTGYRWQGHGVRLVQNVE